LSSADDKYLVELGEAARRAGSILTEQIDAMVEGAERRSEEIRREAQRDAERRSEEIRRKAQRDAEQRGEEIRHEAQRDAEHRREEIRREAQREAEEKRHAAVTSAQMLLERIAALERPLAELVLSIRSEMERVSGELESGNHVDAHASALPAELHSSQGAGAQPSAPAPPAGDPKAADREEATRGDDGSNVRLGWTSEATPNGPVAPEAESGPPESKAPDVELERAAEQADEAPASPEVEFSLVLEHDDAGAVEAESVTEPETEDAPAPELDTAVATTDDPDVELSDAPKEADEGHPEIPVTVPSETAAESEGKSRRSRRARRSKRERKGTFITKEGHCAVCQRTFMAGSLLNLEASHWKVNGEVGLCPDCQSEGWQLPDGARLPFRRGGS
jgi:vacuolar-type H+-ATPase subunit H